MATSMRRRTAMSTRTPGAVGTKPKGRLNPQATREPTPLLLTGMESRQRAAGRRPLAAVAAAVGNPGRIVLVVRQAAVVVAGGVVVGRARDAPQRSELERAALVKSLRSKFWRM